MFSYLCISLKHKPFLVFLKVILDEIFTQKKTIEIELEDASGDRLTTLQAKIEKRIFMEKEKKKRERLISSGACLFCIKKFAFFNAI